MRLSRIAGIRHVGESFNQMAERIAALIENQRSLTNAVSHELRTPLARLSFEVDMLGRGGLPPTHQHVLRDMRADISELENMVAELLVYARLERPTEETVRLETVDTRDWLGEALAQVAHQAQARNVECRVADGHPPHVCLHPRYMSRALLNLGAERCALRPRPHRHRADAQSDRAFRTDRRRRRAGNPGGRPRADLRALHPAR